MKRILQTAIVLVAGLLPAAPRPGLGQTAERTPVATTPHFAFYSDFATNLNDALKTAGRARKKGGAELFHSGDETSCFEALPPSARAGWDRAVDYYEEIVSPASFGDRRQFLIRVALAGFDDEIRDQADRQYVAIAQGFLAAAAPAYRACRWSAQDAENHRWIEALEPRLATYEAKIATRLEALYQTRWGALPIPVDVVETVSWAGANTILRDPAGGHILVSVENQEPAALEVVFHESSHLLMRHGDPIQQALYDAAQAAGYHLPRDLWHVVLFYTTGEAVQEILAEGGEPGYRPMVYGIFDRGGSWTGYREALETEWRPYLDGGRTLSEASGDLVRALQEKARADEKPAKPQAP